MIGKFTFFRNISINLHILWTNSPGGFSECTYFELLYLQKNINIHWSMCIASKTIEIQIETQMNMYNADVYLCNYLVLLSFVHEIIKDCRFLSFYHTNIHFNDLSFSLEAGTHF